VAVAASMQAHKEARAHCITNEKRHETQTHPYEKPFSFVTQLEDPEKPDSYIDHVVEGKFVNGDMDMTSVFTQK
jgi:hypothetical protein